MEKENVEKIVNVDSIIGNIIITGDLFIKIVDELHAKIYCH